MQKKYIAFIDFEMNTNGDMNKNDLEIIEYAVVKYDSLTGKEVSRYIGFVHPISINYVYSFTTFLTGISNDDLKRAKTFKKMLKNYVWFTRDCQRIYYWGDVDKKTIINSIDKIGIRYNNAIKDTLRRMHDFQQEVRGAHAPRNNTSLLNVARKLSLINGNIEQAHRATPDAELLAQVYFAIRLGKEE